jgi:hypothetical protein
MAKGRNLPSLEPLSEAEAEAMIANLRGRGAASDAAARYARARPGKAGPGVSEEAGIREQLSFAKLLLDAGKLGQAEYCFYALAAIERARDRRWLAGAYDGDMQPIAAAMEAVERAHGLEEDECFSLDSAPPDWLRLNRDYEAALDSKLEDLLREFDLPDLLELHRRDRERIDQLREAGRLAVFSESGAEAKILNLIEIYEREVKGAAMAGAYLAAAMTLACAAEARLILHCLRRPDAAFAAAQRLAADVRPKNSEPLSWTVGQLVALAHAGGWLHNLSDEQLVLAVASWLDDLPARRPGRQVLGGRPPPLGDSEFETARAAYAALRHSLDLAANSSPPGETLQ